MTIHQQLSYLAKLGLARHPFPVAPDDENFFASAYTEQVIAELVHGIEARKGFMVLSGDVGLGKTTITRRVLRILERQGVQTSLVFHTSLKDVDLLREINRDFGLHDTGALSDGDQLGDQLQQLNEFLLNQYHHKKNCAIIIDDAQNLDRSSLELVRMLSNLEADQQKLVQILLVGQTELAATLKSRMLRQLNSRIVIHKIVRAMSPEELRHYVLFKLSTAGNNGRISLTRPAFRRLHRCTKGNYRRLNMLMDRCLYALCNSASRCINRQIVNVSHADLSPHPRHFFRRPVALAASILVPIMIATGSWGLHLHTGRRVSARTPDGEQRFKVPRASVTSIHSQSIDNEVIRHLPGPENKTRPASVDSAVEDFLNVYQLGQYTAEFQSAIRAGTMDVLAQRIYRERGFQLVQLPAVPDSIRKRYGALAFPLSSQQQPTWLLFWRPQLKLKRFYYKYHGQEIFELQERFARLKLYRFKLDGIVGTRLMQAVINFQEQKGLHVTGFPDPATLFWLYHQQKERA